MRRISRQALVPYLPEKMFALVDDVPSYPGFLPWCRKAEILERDEREALARIEVHKGPLHARFTTRNRLDRPASIALQLVEGPFRALEGEWRFTAIGDKGSRVELALAFAFANPLNAWILEPVFEHTCSSLVDAFVARARALYGGASGATL